MEDCAYDPAHMEILGMSSRALDKAEELARRVWNAGWTVVHHNNLPKWLKDNEFLLHGHRPQLSSFRACFKSVFRIHTETGNIWTHLLGTYEVITTSLSTWFDTYSVCSMTRVYISFILEPGILCLKSLWGRFPVSIIFILDHNI